MKKIFFIFSFCWSLFNFSFASAQQFASPSSMSYTVTADDMAVSGLNIQALLDSGRAVRNSDGSYTINNIDQNFINRVEQAIINGRMNQKKQQEQAAINQYRENQPIILSPSSSQNSQNPPDSSSSQNNKNNASSSPSGGGDSQAGDNSQTAGGGSEQYGGGKATTLFEHLITSASEIFRGLKLIIYAVTGLSIVAIAIGAFFGNLNWKWLGSVIICLLLISAAQGVLNYLTENNVDPAFKLDDTIETAAPRSNALK